MSIIKKGKYYYGEDHNDLNEVLYDFSKTVGYLIDHFKTAKCLCGNNTFRVLLNEEEGVARRVCWKCNNEHDIADSEDFIDEVETLDELECLCEEGEFRITVGVSLYENSEDVKWFYLGLYCPNCNCLGCYGDWKNEYIGYKELLEKV